METLLGTWERLVWKRGTLPSQRSMHQNTRVPPSAMQNSVHFWLEIPFLLSLHYERQTRLFGGQLAISATIGN